MIYNRTDGIPAGFYEWDSIEEAQEQIDRMREAFRSTQGYYRDNKGNKINPDEIQYEIKEYTE